MGGEADCWEYEGRSAIVEGTRRIKRVLLANGAAFWVPTSQIHPSSEISYMGRSGKLVVYAGWHREQPEGYAEPRKSRAEHG